MAIGCVAPTRLPVISSHISNHRPYLALGKCSCVREYGPITILSGLIDYILSGLIDYILNGLIDYILNGLVQPTRVTCLCLYSYSYLERPYRLYLERPRTANQSHVPVSI